MSRCWSSEASISTFDKSLQVYTYPDWLGLDHVAFASMLSLKIEVLSTLRGEDPKTTPKEAI